MRPTDHKIDVSLCEALSCAEYRFPALKNLRSEAAELCLGFRYGLIGIAAVSFIIRGCDERERSSLLPQLRFFGTMIREHVEQDVESNASHRISVSQPAIAQATYLGLFERFCELNSFHCSIDLQLSILVEEFVSSHSREIRGKLFSLTGRNAKRQFDQEAQKSLHFALCFLERRNFDLEELPEIALLGE